MSSQQFFENVDLSSVPKEFICEICTYPMVSPQITNPCGHPICGHCADQLVKNGSQNCHMCRQPRLGFCRNIFAEQLLVNVKLTCKGCTQELTLNEVKNHVTKDCMEIEIPCRQCQASIKRKDDIVHYGSCPKTKITCQCSLKICRQDQEQHREVCRLAEVQCRLRCGSTVQRYLIPSHCLDCPKVVEQCPVRGCGQHFRKGEMQVHKKEKREWHISLMERERTGILWLSAKGRLAVLPQRSPSQQFVLTWTELGAGSGPLASPVFHKLQRRWRLYFQKGSVRLKYIQGLEDIAVVPSFFVKSRDDKTQVYLDLEGPKYVLLKEGEYIEIRIKCETTPKSITAKIAVVNPMYSYMQP